MRKIILYLLFCSVLKTFGQYSIYGTINDNKGNPIAYATVSLLKDTIIIRSTVTDNTGVYRFNNISSGQFKLIFSCINYQNAGIEITAKDILKVDMVLQPDTGKLALVNVTAKKQLIERKVDRYIVNVAQLVAGASNAWEILGKSPLIAVKEPASIVLAGTMGATIQINGRLLKMPAEVLATYLKGISANAIEKIEIITTPSSEYEADSKGGIINIILKKPAGDGWLGGVQLSSTQLTYNNQSLTGNWEYQKNKFTLYGYCNISNSHFLTWQDLNSNYSFKQLYADVSNQAISVTKDAREKNVSGNIGVDYSINKNNQVGYVMDYALRTMDRGNNATTRYQSPANGSLDSLTISNGGNTEKTSYFNADLFYKIQLNNKGQSLKVMMSSYWYKEDRDGTLETVYKADENSNADFRTLFRNALPLNITNKSVNIDYNYPWAGSKFQLNIGARYGTTKNDGNIQYEWWNGSGYVSDMNESQFFLYKENVAAFYSTFTQKVNKFINYRVGMRVEQTHTKNMVNDQSVTRTYTNYLPNVFVYYSKNPLHQFSYSFIEQLQRPSFFDVNPFKIYSTDRVYMKGDPFLVPSKRFRNELAYTLKGKHVFQLIYSQTLKRISTQTVVDSLGAYHLQKGNFSDYSSLLFVTSYNPQIFSWLNTSLNGYAGYLHFSGNINGYAFSRNSAYFSASLNASVVLKKWWISTIGFDVSETAPFYSDNDYIRNSVIMNAFVSKKIGDAWRFSFSVNDIFHSGQDRYRTIYENTLITSKTYREMISGVRLTAVYNFQHKQKNNSINKNSSNSEEKKRIGR